jgi:hypothetical protein
MIRVNPQNPRESAQLFFVVAGAETLSGVQNVRDG